MNSGGQHLSYYKVNFKYSKNGSLIFFGTSKTLENKSKVGYRKEWEIYKRRKLGVADA